MEFSFQAYFELLEKIERNGYHFVDYFNYKQVPGKRCIIRHDIDFSLKKASSFSEFEAEHELANSTYFVLLTSDFYNLFSAQSRNYLRRIIDNGFNVGLHFDEMAYPDSIGNREKIVKQVCKEFDILNELLNGDASRVVSMHRPSKSILSENIVFPGLVNSYSEDFFSAFKYISDSRRRWREPVEKVVSDGKNDSLHILTHPFWYEAKEKSIKESISDFIKHANMERYNSLCENISDIESIMKRAEV